MIRTEYIGITLLLLCCVASVLVWINQLNVTVIHATPILSDNKSPMYIINPPVYLEAGREYIIIFDRPEE
jgi:hypothetical protein